MSDRSGIIEIKMELDIVILDKLGTFQNALTYILVGF